MLRFKVFENGAAARQVPLKGAYLVGSDHIPLRGAVRFEGGEIVCECRSGSAAALCMAWPVKGFGSVVLETPRLQDRERPYNLLVELARGQMMRISLKREDWGLYDCPEGTDVYREVDSARELLLEAMTAPDELASWSIGEKALSAGVLAGESVGGLHARVSFARRCAANQIPERVLGCRLSRAEVFGSRGGDPAQPQRIPRGLDYVCVPLPWRDIEPKEGKVSLAAVEPWVRALQGRKVPMWVGSLLSFEDAERPTWWAGSAKNYDRLRESAQRHMKQVLKALSPHVTAWEVASGLHARNPLRLTDEQIYDLTRMAVQTARQASPRTPIILSIAPPWGDYYAVDHHTIPPLLYAERASVIVGGFDGFGIELCFGRGQSDRRLRDLLQVSALLDRLGNLDRPVHVTAAGVPSEHTNGGESWRGPWSEKTQAQWLGEFVRLALGKPFVESVAWCAMADVPGSGEFCGLLRADLTPKPAFHEFLAIREELEGKAAG